MYFLLQLFGTAHFVVGAIDCALEYNGKKYFYVYDHENVINYARNYFLRLAFTKEKTGNHEYIILSNQLEYMRNFNCLFFKKKTHTHTYK